MGRNDEDWPVFWCSLLSPLRLGEIPEGEREQYFHELAKEERLLPNGRRGTISVRTLRRQWKRLREQGVAGLYRQRRGDRGQSRKNQAELLARAVQLKKEQPRRSAKVINRILRREFGREVPHATLYRHLRQAGATRRKLGISQEKVRCRWSRDLPNALWVGDFEHGPPVMHEGQAIKTHLSAWIDCHSRYLVEARYYVRENLDILIDSLLRAWGQHGASRELYVDNAKIYHSRGLALACTELNIKLLHRPPRDPPAGGLIERVFQTLQGQFEAEVRAASLLTLAELNRALAAWLAVAYHQEVHSETQQTPHQRYQDHRGAVRHVHLPAVLRFFHQRVERRVNEDHSDVQLENLFFQVDLGLRGDKVIVEYDPFAPLEEVQLHSLAGAYLGVGRRYQREKGSHPSLPPVPPAGPVQPHYLDALRAECEALHAQRRASGIDYRSAQDSSRWSLTAFAGQFARLLGRKTGLSAVTAQEMEILAAFHARHPKLHEGLLKEAFQRAASSSIPEILFALQTLLHERNC